MSTGGSQDNGAADGQVEFQIDHVRVSPTRTRLTARMGGDLVHQDLINLSIARARERFAERVADRTGVDPEDVEEELLRIADELAELYGDDEGHEVAQAQYQMNVDHEDPERRGLFHVGRDGPAQITNFTLEVVEDVRVVDDFQSRREFRCRAVLDGTTSEFTVSAEDFASNTRLPEAIFAAVGPKARILCKPYVLRTAVSAVSNPTRRTVTTSFGWDVDGTAYLVPSGRIDAHGFHPVGPTDAVRVDLGGEECASHLDMRPLEPDQVEPLKRHIVDDYLRLLDRRVMYSLLATIALAVLQRFVRGKNRFSLWLVGLTGGGKSFAAKLAQNFFGDFPIEEGKRVGSWSSTSNFLQRVGYFFRDALFLIDDYKLEVTRHQDVVKLLQNNADGSARGRLNADATTNVSRPIRGLVVATGEDTPEHTPSSVARTVIVKAPSGVKEIDRGRRCLDRRHLYPCLMADFIRHLIAEGRTAQFAARVEHYQRFYYEGIAGRQNDLRIASNFALLAAAFEEFALYLGEAWPRRHQAIRWFTAQALIELRDEMVGTVQEQQASAIFLETLATLLAHGHVRVIGYTPPNLEPAGLDHKHVIGRRLNRQGDRTTSVFEISTALAIEAVQASLRKQGLPPLPANPKTLLGQLAADGKLLDRQNRTIDPRAGGERTRPARLGGVPKNVFRIAAAELIGEPSAGAEPSARQDRPGGTP